MARPKKGQPWPPDYVEIFAWRQQQLLSMRAKPELIVGAREYYKTRPAEFIEHWCVTYDPRNAGTDKLTTMPFKLFPRQRELVEFVHACIQAQEGGLVEKCRDMGATWLCCAYSVWLWLFWPGAAVGWGSRKEELVDRIGDPKSIFEKIRKLVDYMPDVFMPVGFERKKHLTYMKVINPENEATISGEVGDNIGRGGRTLIYFKDEAQPLDAKILTPAGWSTMGAMAVGAKVIGPDGRPRRVIAVNDCGVHDVYRVTFSDGTSTRCSPNHLWTVDVVWGKRERRTLRTVEIAGSFSYGAPGGQRQYRYRVPVCRPVAFDRQDGGYPLDPYLVGALLGDGSVGSVPGHSPKITTVDAEIVDQFRMLLPAGCTIRQEAGRPTWRVGDERGRCGRKHKSRARQAVVGAGIAGMRGHEKRVPERYLLAAAETRLAVLQGLMDTDGSAANGGAASFHTSSPGLADDVRFLVQSLGGTATRNVKVDRRGFKDQHVLHLAVPGAKLFRLKRKLAQHSARTHPVGRTIVAVELCGREEVRCISVDAEDGLYLTDDLIVTHNSAHYQHPELIEAALGDNTNVQIDISSVNGIGNVFHRRREAGADWSPGRPILKGRTNVFVMDWRDHPAKTREWYKAREQKAKDDGLLHVFRQEVDRDYAASLTGVIIPPEWVKAAIDADKVLDYLNDDGGWSAALDVGDGGLDRNALTKRKGVVLKYAEEWGDADTGETTRRAIGACEDCGQIDLQYDCIGVGAGVKAEANRLGKENLLASTIKLIKWDAGAGPLYPGERVVEGDKESPLNKDFYANLKAQGWWMLRTRFWKTFCAVTKGIKYSPDELISISSEIPTATLRKLEKELSQPTAGKSARMKLMVNKTPENTASPNLGDSTMMNYWPMPGATFETFAGPKVFSK